MIPVYGFAPHTGNGALIRLDDGVPGRASKFSLVTRNTNTGNRIYPTPAQNTYPTTGTGSLPYQYRYSRMINNMERVVPCLCSAGGVPVYTGSYQDQEPVSQENP